MTLSKPAYLQELIKFLKNDIAHPTIAPESLALELSGKGTVSCAEYHAHSCPVHAVNQLFKTMQRSYMYFLVIHLVPLILFKRKEIMKNPKQELLKRAIYYVRSMCYMCGCLAIMRLVHCYYRRLFGSSGASMGLGTGFGCLAVMFEIESRQKEIFLFMLPRIMEICWKFLKRRHLVKSLPFAEHFIFAFAVGVVVDSVHRKIDSRASVTSAIKMILGKL